MKNNKNNKNNNNKVTHIIIYIILIIMIILLLLKNCASNNKKNPKVLSGNVDIFEINCDKETCKVDIPKEDKDKDKKITVNNEKINETKENEVTNSKEKENQDKEEFYEGNVIAYDKNTTWTSSNKLRIFTNSMYESESIIAPEDSNTYEFIIKNNTIYNVKYSIKFTEINPNGINMKYKLKRGKEYLAGDDDNWVNYNELDFQNQFLNISENDTYYLEWKWESSTNDAQAGNITANYELKIELYAEEIE